MKHTIKVRLECSTKYCVDADHHCQFAEEAAHDRGYCLIFDENIDPLPEGTHPEFLLYPRLPQCLRAEKAAKCTKKPKK